MRCVTVASPVGYSAYALSILKDEQAEKNSSKGQVVYNDLGIGLPFDALSKHVSFLTDRGAVGSW